MWAPEPVRLAKGLAMNVAIAPDPPGKLAGHHPEEESVDRPSRVRRRSGS